MSTPDLSTHPCFNTHARHRYGRIHLPVAPRCNIQCRFCNRREDCVNESRPGVTSAVLTPVEALRYLQGALERVPDISVVGIAGPGDPFANPEQTLETLTLVRNHYPEMLLCVATNGMAVAPYVERLAELKVSHVTVTVNAVDPAIGAGVYRWMRDGPHVLRGEAAAARLLERQVEAIQALKKHNIVVKINTIVIPGLNEHHVEAVARRMTELGADIFNCMPLLPAKGSDFEDRQEPDAALMAELRRVAGAYLPQMSHCARCRADAAGRLGEANSDDLTSLMRACRGARHRAKRARSPYVAVATREGLLVNQHLGETDVFHVFGKTDEGIRTIAVRPAPKAGSGDSRWEAMAQTLQDCHTVLVSNVGKRPREVLRESGIETVSMEGLIEPALLALFDGKPVPEYLTCRAPKSCSGGGGGGGCGA